MLRLQATFRVALFDNLILFYDFSVFMEKSLKDFERFKKQKVRDINEIMENYIKTQIKVNKMVSGDSNTFLAF